MFEEMIYFLEHKEHWENTEAELATRGVTTFFSLYIVSEVSCLDPTGVDDLTSFLNYVFVLITR